MAFAGKKIEEAFADVGDGEGLGDGGGSHMRLFYGHRALVNRGGSAFVAFGLSRLGAVGLRARAAFWLFRRSLMADIPQIGRTGAPKR